MMRKSPLSGKNSVKISVLVDANSEKDCMVRK